MKTWTFDSPDPERTREVGAALGRSIGRDGLIVALIGPLGAGKTVFVKGLAEGLGIDPRLVSSPTFVIAQEYPLPPGGLGGPGEAVGGPTTLHHLDLYRLESEDELESIGFFDMLAPGNVLAVEWADRFEGVLGRTLLTIEFEGPSAAKADALAQGEDAPGIEAASAPMRRARLEAQGEAAERVLQDLARRVEAAPSSAVSSPGRASSAGRGGAASPEMRLLMMLCLCVLGLAFEGLAHPSVAAIARTLGMGDALSGTGCVHGQEWVALETDALGTLRATCADRSDLDAREATADGSPHRPLVGIGRLVSGERIDLIDASARLLETLPGIGPARAESILAQRRRGAIRMPSDLERVPGIGPKTRARLERWIEVRPSDRESRSG